MKFLLALVLGLSLVSAQPAFVGATSYQSTTVPAPGTFTLQTPLVLPGDLLITFVGMTAPVATSILAPAGWRELWQPERYTQFSAQSVVFYRVANGTESLSYTFTNNGSSWGIVASMVAYRGAHSLDFVSKPWVIAQTYPSYQPLHTQSSNSMVVWFLTAAANNQELSINDPATLRVALDGALNESGVIGDLLIPSPGVIPDTYMTSEYYIANAGAPSVTLVLLP